MVLEYEESMEDLYAFAVFCQEYIPVFRRKIRLYKILAAVTLVFYKPIITWTTKRSVKKLFTKMYQDQKEQLTFGRRTMEFIPEGLTIKTGLTEKQLKWAAVEDIVATKDYIFIIIGLAKAYIVPKRIFSDAESIKDFTQTIKGFREAV